MRVCSSQFYVLEHYLRLVTRKPENWLSALQILTGSPRLSQEIALESGKQGFKARLAFIASETINASGLYVHSAMKVFGVNTAYAAIIMPVRGTIEFEVQGLRFHSGPGVPFVLQSNQEFRAELSDQTEALVIQLINTGVASIPRSFRSGDPGLAKILDAYLIETPFFRNHDHAVERTNCLERSLNRYGEGELQALTVDERRILRGKDRRLRKALELMNEEPEQDIDLEAVARASGLSLRNLYYLMKKHTGMTPTAYRRSRRLIKVRESIVCNASNDLRVCNHALKWGFNHLGRFSSYYRDHFGEYPTDTIRCLDKLTGHARNVVPVGQETPQGRLMWYTSTIPAVPGQFVCQTGYMDRC